MQEAYSRVIDLIAENAIDYRAIGLALAKTQPAAFLLLHDAVSGAFNSVDASMDVAMVALIKQNKFVEAIKHCRTVKGWGLKEAKDYADVLRNRLERGEPVGEPVNGRRAETSKSLALKLKELLSRGDEPTYPDAGSF